MTKIIIISNDKFYISKKKYFFNSNKNTFTILNGFKNFRRLYFYCRYSKKKPKFGKKIPKNLEFINLKKLLFLLKNLKNFKIVIISLTPFNFMISLICKIIGVEKEKIFLFLRSDGFIEYKVKFGKIGYFFYGIMFYFLKNKTNILTCSKFLTGVSETKLLFPSEINNEWLKNRKISNKTKTSNYKVKLLYIGRFRVEKGYLSLIDIFEKLKLKSSLHMVGNDYKYLKKKDYPKNLDLKISGQIVRDKELIKCYDNCDIIILPSYVEAYPQVILESLSRLRPVIIFDDINFLKKTFNFGLYSSARNAKSLAIVIKYIMKNYHKIQNTISKKKIFTQKKFFDEINKIFAG